MRTERTTRRPNNTSTIVRRKDGRYQGFLQVDGTRRAVYGTSEREVARKLEALKAQVIVLGSLPNPGSRTVGDTLDAWLAAARSQLRPRTIDEYAILCNRYIRPAIGAVRLTRLDPYHLQRLYADLQARGLARVPSAVHVALHRAFRLAVLWRWLPENPCDRVVRPAYNARRKDVWTEAQLRTFLGGIGDHWLGPLWTFLVGSGCRVSEAVALTWDDIDGESIRIGESIHRVGGEWVVGDPKTAAGVRSVTLPASALLALRRQRARQAEWRLSAGETWDSSGLVFTTSQGTPLHRATVAHALSKVCKRLSLPPLSPHGFRHLHASFLIARGLPIPAVSARLGHSRVSVTLDVYSHVVGGEDRRAADVIGAAMSNVAVA